MKLKRVRLNKTLVSPVTPSGRNEIRDVEGNVSGLGVAIPITDSGDEVLIPWTCVDYVVRERQEPKK